jgi:hypothetical protein
MGPSWEPSGDRKGSPKGTLGNKRQLWPVLGPHVHRWRGRKPEGGGISALCLVPQAGTASPATLPHIPVPDHCSFPITAQVHLSWGTQTGEGEGTILEILPVHSSFSCSLCLNCSCLLPPPLIISVFPRLQSYRLPFSLRSLPGKFPPLLLLINIHLLVLIKHYPGPEL